MIADRGTRIADRKERNWRVAETATSAEDFRQRTVEFGIRVIRLVESLPKTDGARVIGKQLLRCATAAGANYRAAARGRSRADFIAKMGIVEEECDESLYWLEMLVDLRLISGSRPKNLRGEANEILLNRRGFNQNRTTTYQAISTLFVN